MYKSQVDNFKLDTNIDLILQKSKKTIKSVKSYLTEPDELNFAISSDHTYGNLSSNRADVNFREMVNKNQVPPVWDENLHQIYVKSLVENFMSPVQDNRTDVTNVPIVVQKASNQTVVNLKQRNQTVSLEKSTPSNNCNIIEETEDLASNLQWKPIKQSSELQKTLNVSISPSKKKKLNKQKMVLNDVPKTSHISRENTKTLNRNKQKISNKNVNEIPDQQKIYSYSARSSRISDRQNTKSARIDNTFIRFIGKQHNKSIDFNKEHPDLLVESTENCKTLFPRRILKNDKTINNPVQTIHECNQKKIDQNNKANDLKIDNYTIKVKDKQDCKLPTEFKKLTSFRNESFISKVKCQELQSENIEHKNSKINISNVNNKNPRKTNEERILHIVEMQRNELNINIKNDTNSNNSERSILTKNDFAKMILDNFKQHHKAKSKIKKKSIKGSTSDIVADVTDANPQGNQSEPIVVHSVQNESQCSSKPSNHKDTLILENQNTLILRPTWHEVLTDKIVKLPNPMNMISSIPQKSETPQINEISNKKNLEIIYDKANGFEVKTICSNNDEKLKKLQIKTLPVFCIRGECKIQKAISVEIKPSKNLSNPLQSNNIQYFEFSYNKNKIEEEANKFKLVESEVVDTDKLCKNQISEGLTNQEKEIGNFLLTEQKTLSTIDENEANIQNSAYTNKFAKKCCNLLISNKKNLSPNDSQDELNENTYINISQNEMILSSNPVLSATSVFSDQLNGRNLEEILSTQTDEEKLGIQNETSDTNSSDEDSCINDSNMIRLQQTCSQKLSSTSCKEKKLNDIKGNQSKDILSILENVFMQKLKLNPPSFKEYKDFSSSSSRSLLELPNKHREKVKKKYNLLDNFPKKNCNSVNVFKEAGVQTDEISSQMNLKSSNSTELDIHENLVEYIFEKIRNDTLVGLNEFKSYKLKTEKINFTNSDKEDNKNQCANIENLKQQNQEIKFSGIDEENSSLNRSIISSTSDCNNIRLKPSSSLSILNRSSKDNTENCTFRLKFALDDLNVQENVSNVKKSDSKTKPNINKPLKNNFDYLKKKSLLPQAKLEPLNSSLTEKSEISYNHETLSPTFNLELDDGTSSMFSLASDRIVINKINYQCRSANKHTESLCLNNQSNRDMQNDHITKTVEKVLKDGDTFRSNAARQKCKHSKKNVSPEIQNAVKYFLENLNNPDNNEKQSIKSNRPAQNKNYIKMNKILQMASGSRLCNTTDHYKKINNSINPNIIERQDLDLQNILGSNSIQNTTFNISENSFDTNTNTIDKLIANNNSKSNVFNIKKSVNSYDESSTSSQIIKNYPNAKKYDFKNCYKVHDLSSNITFHELYYSSTDDFLLSEKEQKNNNDNFLIEDCDSQNTGEVLSVSDGEILSIGEIKNTNK